MNIHAAVAPGGALVSVLTYAARGYHAVVCASRGPDGRVRAAAGSCRTVRVSPTIAVGGA